MSAIPFRQDVFYPESDGKPMGETEIHIREIMYLFQALNEHLRGLPDVYVGADLLFYYLQGNPKAFVVPDIFVARGVRKGQRRTYKLWEEGQPPSLVVEVTSDSTREEDLGNKKNLYAQLGVEEYVLHDPLGDYLRPSLQGFRRVHGRFQPMSPGPEGAITSQTAGVTFRIEDHRLRLLDTATGKKLLDHEEQREELDRLRAELERVRGQA